MFRSQYLVTPRARGWVVRSGPVPLRWFPTKHQALSLGVQWASRNRPSELVIQGQDGSIEDRRTYPGDARRLLNRVG